MHEKNDLYELILKKGELRIGLEGCLSCILWGKYWGIVHKIFESKEYLNEYNVIKVDLSRCCWADPMPLLSILLELLHMKQDYGRNIKIFLPRLSKDNENNINYHKGRFLKFLASQGFMEIMLDYFSVSDSKEILNVDKVKKYANYNYKLHYNGAEVIQAKIFDITEGCSRLNIIDKIEEEFLFRFKNTVSLQTYNVLIEQIDNILNELIENVERHAYQEKERKRFGLYIRKRYGAVKNYGVDPKSIMQYQDELKQEKKNCPALDNQVLIEGEAVLEIFFVDIGMGLKESLKDYYTMQLKKNYKYPIRELFYMVFKDGIRKNKSTALTPYGGLHFIGRILRQNKGYIWCNEGAEWIGASSVGVLNGSKGETKIAYIESEGHCCNIGLRWCFRIPYSDISKTKNSIGETWEQRPNMHPVFIAYKDLDRNMYVNRVMCKDDRYEKCIMMNGEILNWATDILNDSNEFHKCIGKVDTYIWFPKSHHSKNTIITLLKDYVEKIINRTDLQKNKINIIIGEINSNELISYYYALNDISTNVLGCRDIVSLILITKKWEVVYFENLDYHLKNNSRMSQSFFAYNVSNSTKVHENIKEYAKMLRIYDSYIFWNFVKKHQDEKIYINSPVVWSAENTINGYLDFERIYLYEEVYLLLKNALSRTSGLVNNAEIEYRNIDYASSRICQEFNAGNFHTEHKAIYPMNVGGACASGYTKESYYKENKVDINIMFFAHPSFKKKINDTAFLFIWPNGDFFADFVKENDKYYRLGKTNLITRNRNEMLIDTKKIYKNSIRNKKETYLDFQQKYPKFIKYGHYKTDKHHYLIGFDLLTYIRFSYLKKEGAFVYILWKIANFLGKGEMEEVYSNLKDVEWVKTLKECKYEDKLDKGEVVVYHSNTFTEYIIKLVKDILPDFLVSRMIPINIIEIQPKGAPITFSPFTLDLLKKTFDTGDRSGILYVDSSFSTGRKMLEIENILLSTGCKNVTFLSVFDMRRLRNEDARNLSYWKINLPRLDDDNHCILCSTLKTIENFRDKVDKEINLRIQEWFTNWKCMSVTNSISGHGIEMQEGLQCNIDSIPLYDSNSLNICVAEKLCESYSNDYVYKFICQKTDLSVWLKIQLICTQLCLYGNQNSKQLQLSLLSELIGNMAKCKSTNAYTSLAGIVLISQSESLICELLNEILYLNQNSKILSIKKYLLNSENIDLVIALGYFVKNYHMIEQLISGYKNKNKAEFKMIELINEHLLTEKDLKLLSKEFEGLLINEQGRRHNTNIQKLLLDHVTDFGAFKERCRCVKNDIQRMYEIAKHFPISMANSRELISDSENALSDLIGQMENLMFLEEEKYNKERLLGQEISRFLISDDLKNVIVKCQRAFEDVLKSYFITFSEETKQYFAEVIAKYEEKYNKKIKFTISINDTVKGLNKWYYWHQGIEKEFQYLLENLEHCTMSIKEEEENVKMIVEVHFDFNNIFICLKSWSEVTADLVKNKFLSKNRLSKEQAIAFDVMFEFDNLKTTQDGNFLLETKMSIPACYQQLKGE